jgi:hypothetical protein
MFSTVSLKLTYPSPFILSVEKVPLPPHALLVLIVVRVLPLSVRFTNALLSLSLLGVNSPPVVVAGTTLPYILVLVLSRYMKTAGLKEVILLH